MKKTLILFVLLVSAAPLFAGLTYDFKSVTTGRGAGSSSLAGTTAVEGRNMRIDFTSGDELLFKSNTVLISRDGGQTFLMLDPGKKTYYDFSLEEILKMAGSVLKAMGGMVQMSVTNQKVAATDAGAGEKLEGYETQKHVVKSAYDLSMKIMGMTTKSHVETTTETSYTTKIPSEYMTFIQQKGWKTGFEDLDKLIDAQTSATKGFPLFQIVTTKSTSGKRTETVVITTTISNIRSGTVPDTRFEVPPGYQKEETPVLPGLPH